LYPNAPVRGGASMTDDRLERIGDYPFDRLRALLGPATPRVNDPIFLSIGEPQHPPPPVIQDAVTENFALWGRYPPMAGTPEFRRAVAGWLARRYGLPAGMIDPDAHVIPVSGTREALFMAALAVLTEARLAEPKVLMPNPFYQVYLGAAVIGGAEPVLVPATREAGFLPDFAGLDAATLDRTAMAYYCSPANPQGAIAPLETLKELVLLARRHDFVMLFDECYSEIYQDAPPSGGMAACAALGGGLDNVLVFNSLSKRSSAPGLRSGFVAGDKRLIKRFTRLRDYGGAPPPLPLLAAATALWGDEAHVEENRLLYHKKFALAAAALDGRCGFYTPGGGFYLWLDVGDGEDAAKRLWEAGVRVMPGAYLAQRDATGRNPGAGYIRCALVHDLDTTERALTRMSAVL
jgi:succinyldiaminopimelate transaminase